MTIPTKSIIIHKMSGDKFIVDRVIFRSNGGFSKDRIGEYDIEEALRQARAFLLEVVPNDSKA